MLKEFVDKIVELAPIDIHDDEGGRKHSDRKLHPIIPPLPKTVEVNTLEGFIELCKQFFEKSDVFVHVKNYDEVCLSATKTDEWEQRPELVCASLENYPFGFVFGQKYDSEQFNISLQSMFRKTAERDAVLAVVGNMTSEQAVTVQDDGVTQTVGQRTGMVLKSRETIPNPVNLVPIRTFREVEQPVVPCVFRVSQDREGLLPKCALHEADGGEWKITAINTVAAYLKAKLPEFVIIA